MNWTIGKILGVSLALVASMLAACGGGGSGGVGTDGTGPPTISINVGAATSVDADKITVNGVSYDAVGATLTDGFGQVTTFDTLRLGMWIEVNGTGDQASGDGVAKSISVRPAARGIVSSVDAAASTVVVLESTARYGNGATVVEGVEAASQIRPGDLIEVHGALGAGAGAVEATRIERLPAVSRKPFELRGRVADLDTTARTLTVGRQTIVYDRAALTLRQALANGQIVRVTSASPPASGRAWSVERLTSDQPLLDNIDFAYIESLTTDWAAGPTFKLEGVPVNATEASGTNRITGNDQRVAVIGEVVSGTLKAKSAIRILRGDPPVFVLRAPVTDFKSIADFRVRDVTIDATSAAFVGGTAADLADGRGVRVTGTVSGRKLIATRIQFV